MIRSGHIRSLQVINDALLSHTCIRPFVELACNPLDEDLLEEQDTRRYHERKQDISHELGRRHIRGGCPLLHIADEVIECDEDGDGPCEECSVSDVIQ